MANPVVSWARENPVAAGAAALGVIVVIMLVTGGSGSQEDSGSGGMGSAGVQAYYAAVANQSQAGAAIQIAEVQANAETNKALIAANYGIESAKVWAPIQMQGLINEATNNAATIQLQREALQSNERIDANHVNLANATLAANTALGNAQLAVQQNIAFKQINGKKKSFLDNLQQFVGTATQVGAAVGTGGASVGLSSILGGGGSSAVKLPSMGSSGQWI